MLLSENIVLRVLLAQIIYKGSTFVAFRLNVVSDISCYINQFTNLYPELSVLTLSNLCQLLKSSPVFSDHVIVKLSCDQTGSSQNGGLTFVAILYPELSLLLRSIPSLSMLILQDFCKI
jgi:hypothetical protein